MTNPTLEQLQQKYDQLEIDFKRERSALEKQMSELKKLAQVDAVARIRSIMDEYGIAAADISSPKKTRRGGKQGPVAAKYRGPTGETWTGRGRQPKWIGSDREKFRIKE